MSIEVIKIEKFIDYVKKAFTEITKELVDSEYNVVSENILKDNAKVAIIIGICGNTKGRILLESDFETASNFAVAMNFGDFFEDPKDMYLYVAEFANMFCGRATTYINNEYQNREFWLSPPAIFSAENLEILSPTIHSEVAYYSGEQGSFIIDIGIEEV
ncbi:MAG: chemotaxis protein CheX [bacterium]